MMPALDTQALFSDGTSFYRNPPEPSEKDTTTIRMRTAKDNVDEVLLCYGEQKVRMYRAFSDRLFDFYEAQIPPSDHMISYYFEIHSGHSHCFYHQRGVVKEPNEYYNFRIMIRVMMS